MMEMLHFGKDRKKLPDFISAPPGPKTYGFSWKFRNCNSSLNGCQPKNNGVSPYYRKHPNLTVLISIIWVLALSQDASDHQDYYIFSRSFLKTFICHCYREGTTPKLSSIFFAMMHHHVFFIHTFSFPPFSFHSNSLPYSTLVWKDILQGKATHVETPLRTFVEVHPNWRRTSLHGAPGGGVWIGGDPPVVCVNTPHFPGCLVTWSNE